MIIHMDFMELVSWVVVIIVFIVALICCIKHDRKNKK